MASMKVFGLAVLRVSFVSFFLVLDCRDRQAAWEKYRNGLVSKFLWGGIWRWK